MEGKGKVSHFFSMNQEIEFKPETATDSQMAQAQICPHKAIYANQEFNGAIGRVLFFGDIP